MKASIKTILICFVVLLIFVVIFIVYDSKHSSYLEKRNRTVFNSYLILWALTGYYNDHGKWPDDKIWQKELLPYVANNETSSNPFSRTNSTYHDAWGNIIKYVNQDTINQPGIYFYSFGPNGRDDMRKGDDIDFKINTSETNTRLSILTKAFSEFCKSSGVIPDETNWQELLIPDIMKLEDFTLSLFSANSVFKDMWGNKIQLTITKHKDTINLLVYSFGENGLDDKMRGDDLVSKTTISRN
ncbi:MAG: hypothetical protein IID32_06800 [Planctomycetes bacterium]|nr:hypothetical protein [Planctomycetota bacterium]